jgi:hypothetical protein
MNYISPPIPFHIGVMIGIAGMLLLMIIYQLYDNYQFNLTIKKWRAGKHGSNRVLNDGSKHNRGSIYRIWRCVVYRIRSKIGL